MNRPRPNGALYRASGFVLCPHAVIRSPSRLVLNEWLLTSEAKDRSLPDCGARAGYSDVRFAARMRRSRNRTTRGYGRSVSCDILALGLRFDAMPSFANGFLTSNTSATVRTW
jgi:hypothetical protein